MSNAVEVSNLGVGYANLHAVRDVSISVAYGEVVSLLGPNGAGKSTLFKTLTKKQVLIANYPFATIDPNVGVVEVPDDRLAKLAALDKSARIASTKR